MHPRSRLLACSLVTAALVLGCSDDAPEIDEDADQELVDEVALTVDDLPDGFEEVDDDGDEGTDAFDECGDEVGLDEDEIDDNKVAESDDDVAFSLADDTSFTQIASTVATVRDPGLASRQLEAFDDDDFFDCVADALEEQATEDGDVSDFSIDTTSPAVDGDASAAVAIEISSQGVDFEMEVHMVLIDRVGITLQVLSGPDGVDDGLVDDAFDAMLDRLEAAQE